MAVAQATCQAVVQVPCRGAQLTGRLQDCVSAAPQGCSSGNPQGCSSATRKSVQLHVAQASPAGVGAPSGCAICARAAARAKASHGARGCMWPRLLVPPHAAIQRANAMCSHSSCKCHVQPHVLQMPCAAIRPANAMCSHTASGTCTQTDCKVPHAALHQGQLGGGKAAWLFISKSGTLSS